MKIFDLHCDTIMRFYHGEHLRASEEGHISLEKLRRGDWLCQCFAIFVPWKRPNYPADPKEYFDRAYAAWRRELDLCADALRPAETVEDILANDAAGVLSGMLTVEDCVTLDGELANVDDWYAKGVRMAALTWNHENSLGFPNSPDPARHALGLKPFGLDAVARMNDLGIAVDVSHLSEGGFWDVAKHSRAPIVASHSCARALCDHPRNLTDAQLRAVGDSGGIVGVNYYARFLRSEATDERAFTTCEDVARHLRYMADRAGMDAVGLGSDYDGMGSVLEWGDAAGQQTLIRALEGRFSTEELEKICHTNAERVFRDVQRAARG